MTTNKTEFFREAHHFEYLRDTWLPSRGPCRRAADRHLRLWSAGCCTGEEAYSLAISLCRALPDLNGWDVSILATDINPHFLQRAQRGVFRRHFAREERADAAVFADDVLGEIPRGQMATRAQK